MDQHGIEQLYSASRQSHSTGLNALRIDGIMCREEHKKRSIEKDK